MTEGELTRHDLLPSLSSLLGVLILFFLALSLTRAFEPQIVSVVSDHEMLGLAIFFGTTALAVVFPVFTNLPLVPVAVLLWGPWWTAFVMFLGWIAGSALSFALAQHFRPAVVRSFPAVSRYADIDRLILPSRPILSLVLLRMTFPVDVLSYVLGLFSARTSAKQNLLSTAIGVAPFALLFASFPALSLAAQSAFLGACTVVLLVYVLWMRPGVHDEPTDRTPELLPQLGDRYPDVMRALDGLGAAARHAGPLDEKTVHLVQLAAAAASRSEGAVHSHTRRAQTCGASPEEIRHALISLVSTIGFPNVVAALSWADDQLDAD